MLKLFSIALFLFCSLLNAQDLFKFDLIQKGEQDANTLLVVGGIQGDEPGGFISASLLATHYEITKGSLWIVPNLNFYSIIKRSRGPHGDMNRKFAELSEEDPEYEAIQRIKSYIKDENVKLVVNLHDGSGFYRKTYEDDMHAPHRWGQCSIIDQSNIDVEVYSNLEEISSSVVKYVNEHLIKDEHKYHVHNTRTKEGDKEMEKTLTYFAINEGKAAFGNEASKNLATHQRVYYHLLALEKYMDIMGIEYKRKFTLDSDGVYSAINNDIHISLYEEKISLPLAQIRDIVNYFPIKKDGVVDFKASNPLLAIIKNGNTYVIQYGNRRLSRLNADYLDMDEDYNIVKFSVDGKEVDVKFGEILKVENSFVVHKANSFRVNVIGYVNKSGIETGVEIEKKQIQKRFSIDKTGTTYRVEYYNKEKFVGMVLVRFKN
ncbi:MAG: succinylglutamate desuccinylase/aspartoacylase family protein [Sulfurimonas sp.]|uniref:M99 family carboxypeptidase catalytic domain-containing protein n=1 Tax=Sulfurimonas sp. TaxID=2022749 RepID=UPI0025D82171|nr:M99 family carboxypeptidase catalytic domain-containing protein [Sulfurimonas sp.]MCK9492088.1 succinylglutamate desuccinylase/aspartoacylase family protein [Sulfurimonas sp.]